MMTEEIPNSLVYQRLRNQVIAHLELLASEQEQLDYQKKVPIAHVSAELFEMWSDIVNPEASKEQFPLGLYSAAERSEAHKFNQVFLAVRAATSSDLPTIEEFIGTEQWHKLQQIAKKALAVFEVRGYFSEDNSEDKLEW